MFRRASEQNNSRIQKQVEFYHQRSSLSERHWPACTKRSADTNFCKEDGLCCVWLLPLWRVSLVLVKHEQPEPLSHRQRQQHRRPRALVPASALPVARTHLDLPTLQPLNHDLHLH